MTKILDFLNNLLFINNNAKPVPKDNKVKNITGKSQERIENEKKILDARRKILENMSKIDEKNNSKNKILNEIDKDASRVTDVVRSILQNEIKK